MAPAAFGLAVRAAIMDDAGRVLVLRRSASNRVGVGEWEWPGGKGEPGERLDETVVREVHEECGLSVEPTGLVGAYELVLPGLRAVSVCLRARVVGGALALSDEHDAATWAGPDELAALPLTPPARGLMLAFAARAGTPA